MVEGVKAALLVALGAVTVVFLAAWGIAARKARSAAMPPEERHSLYHAVAAFVFCFFDTLGIGNFAPTTSAFKLRGSVPDERIPGTLNVGYTLPTVAQAFIYISSVKVDAWTLVFMIGASVLGAWLGAGVVARLPRRKIQVGMGVALLAAAALLGMRQFNLGPGGGEALALPGPALAAGLAGNFALGAMMTLGIGLYGPCLILVSLLGMNPLAAFPIMMGSCAFLMPVAGIRFVRAGSYHRSASLVLSLAGLPAVFVAAYLVKQMPMQIVRWLVIVVVVFAATLMLRSALAEGRRAAKVEAA